MVKKVQFRAPPKLCTYCDDSPANSEDHIPPKNLFSRPLPPRVVVPACNSCNTVRFGSKLDEQFRDLLSLRIGKNTDESSKFFETRVKPAMIKGTALARLNVDERSSWTEMTSSGMFHRQEPVRTISLEPLEAMAERLARGYYLKRFNERLPIDVAIRDGGFGAVDPDFDMDRIFRPLEEFKECQVVRGSSGGVFKYSGFRHVGAKNDSIWIFDFYGKAVFSAMTGYFATMPHSVMDMVMDGDGSVRNVSCS